MDDSGECFDRHPVFLTFEWRCQPIFTKNHKYLQKVAVSKHDKVKRTLVLQGQLWEMSKGDACCLEN